MDYPANLPDFKVGKNLSVRQGFLHSNVYEGCYSTEHFTRDETAIWSVVVQCSEKQAEDFEGFLSITVQRPFNKSIRTMWGVCDYEVVIIEQPTEPRQISNGVFEYSFKIMAQQLKTKFDNIDRELWMRYSLDFATIDLSFNSVGVD